MAITSGFFNSVNADRRYKADFFAEYFASFISNGVFPNPSTGMQVIANGNMTVSIRSGKAWIKGYYVNNDADYLLSLGVADGVLKRIDRIVLRLDFSSRQITPAVKKGTAASSPIAPSLQRDADAYELGLADVLITNGAISISQANITDNRLNTALCGIVHGVVDQVDTTTIFNQYQAWFNSITSGVETEVINWQAEQQQSFNTWFQSIKDILSGDVAANLATRISQLENDLTVHQAEDATLDTKGHVQLSSSTTSSSETMAATPKAVKKVMDQANSAFMQSDNYNIYKTGKDAKKVYTVVDYKRPNGLIWKKSILSNADTNGNYRTQTINFYDELGTTVASSEKWTITYDSEGDVVSEVKA